MGNPNVIIYGNLIPQRTSSLYYAQKIKKEVRIIMENRRLQNSKSKIFLYTANTCSGAEYIVTQTL
jgi:hypothetical protein